MSVDSCSTFMSDNRADDTQSSSYTAKPTADFALLESCFESGMELMTAKDFALLKSCFKSGMELMTANAQYSKLRLEFRFSLNLD